MSERAYTRLFIFTLLGLALLNAGLGVLLIFLDVD